MQGICYQTIKVEGVLYNTLSSE